MPAFGHVNPSLPVVEELVRRGEQVIYYDDEEFRRIVEGTGATFRPYPAGALRSADIAAATQSGDLTRVVSRIMQATEILLPFLQEELTRERPDVIALDSNALWGHMAARLLDIPTISLMTTFMIDMAQVKMAPRETMHMVLPLLGGVPKVVSRRSRLIRRYGKPAFPPRPAFPARGDLNLAFVPREMQPEHTLVDASFRFVGPTINPDARGDRSRDAQIAALPEPLVHISLGTLHRGSADFFRQCFLAFADLPAYFVVATGEQTDMEALGPVPPNFTVRAFVPQLDVLERAEAFVTHGGMNSVLEGLYYGVPLLLIPQQPEQLAIALGVAASGAGLVLREHMAGKRIPAEELRRTLQSILTEPRFREAAAEAQESLRASGGYRQAADEIQAFIAERRTA